MFSETQYRVMYKKFLGPLAQPVTIKVNNGTGFDEYPDVMAHVSKYKEQDLVPDGSIQLGDIRLIILEENLPDGLRRLEQKDRIEIDARNYSPVHWDDYTRSVGDQCVAVECVVRG